MEPRDISLNKNEAKSWHLVCSRSASNGIFFKMTVKVRIGKFGKYQGKYTWVPYGLFISHFKTGFMQIMQLILCSKANFQQHFSCTPKMQNS